MVNAVLCNIYKRCQLSRKIDSHTIELNVALYLYAADPTATAWRGSLAQGPVV
jgi:hypothetical protein